MKKRIAIVFFALLVVCGCSLTAFAAEGTIRLELPKDMEGKTVYYQSSEGEQKVLVGAEGITVISGLKPGDYQIRIPDTEELEFQTVEVRMPCWDEETKQMSYDVTVQPKYQKNVVGPQTGDERPLGLYIGIGSLSFVGVLVSIATARKSKKKM